jgi:hypothetical protein
MQVENAIRATAELRPVGNANSGHVQLREVLVYLSLIIHVEMRSTFVEKKDSRLAIKSTRQQHPLFLPSR